MRPLPVFKKNQNAVNLYQRRTVYRLSSVVCRLSSVVLSLPHYLQPPLLLPRARREVRNLNRSTHLFYG